MKRRDVLIGMNSWLTLATLGGLPGLTLIPSLGRAGTGAPSRYFVLIRMPTGWDVTLGLDPQVPRAGLTQEDVFIEYRAEDILGTPNLRLGPAGAPLLPYVNDLAVINGVFMSEANVSHEGNLDYISTGSSSGHAADVALELAQATHVGPLGIAFNETLKRGSRKLAITTLGDLAALSGAVELGGLSKFIGGLAGGAFKTAQTDLINSAPIRRRLADKIAALREESTAANGDEVRGSAVTLAAALASGSCFQAQFDIRADLDTHAGHEGRHLEAQRGAWEQVANLFRLFKAVPSDDGRSLFERTTFAVVSEFSRTPALNATRGKDHNPLTNSVLLAGAGVRGGQTLGASQVVSRRHTANGESRHVASPLDLATGRVAATISEARSSSVGFIYPEHVVATLAEIQGASRAVFSSVRADVPALTRVMR